MVPIDVTAAVDTASDGDAPAVVGCNDVISFVVPFIGVIDGGCVVMFPAFSSVTSSVIGGEVVLDISVVIFVWHETHKAQPRKITSRKEIIL